MSIRSYIILRLLFNLIIILSPMSLAQFLRSSQQDGVGRIFECFCTFGGGIERAGGGRITI